eukprot:4177073-Karenia_brevis.AAC.1
MQTPDGQVCVHEVHEMLVLGVLLDRRGSPSTSIDFNLTRAEGAYGKVAKLLKDKTIPCKERLQAWCGGPVGAATYGAGGWALSRINIHQVR